MNEGGRGFLWLLAGVGITLVTDGFGTFETVEPLADAPPAAIEATSDEAKKSAAVATTPPSEKPESEPLGSSVDLIELQDQIAELERLLRDRKKSEGLRAREAAEKPPAPASVEGELAQLLEKQNRFAAGEFSQRDREIERQVQLEALEMVKKLRLDIEAKTKEREKLLEEAMESNR